jgi:hypothetical protein
MPNFSDGHTILERSCWVKIPSASQHAHQVEIIIIVIIDRVAYSYLHSTINSKILDCNWLFVFSLGSQLRRCVLEHLHQVCPPTQGSVNFGGE